MLAQRPSSHPRNKIRSVVVCQFNEPDECQMIASKCFPCPNHQAPFTLQVVLDFEELLSRLEAVGTKLHTEAVCSPAASPLCVPCPDAVAATG